MSEAEYCSLDAQKAQEARLEKAIQVSHNLPYFHVQILKKMLSWEALERPNSVKLKRIFSDDNLTDNLDNKDYVDQLIESTMKMDDSQMMDEINQNKDQESDEDEEESDESL